MLKKLFITLSLFTAIPVFALPTDCQKAVATNDPAFCSSFASSAPCFCVAHGGNPNVCNNMLTLYNYLKNMPGGLDAACTFQRDVPKQVCLDDWNCYINGGKDSNGNLCSGTGNSCV